jgi:transcriptional regulator with PAS, ATPase and Fis domain
MPEAFCVIGRIDISAVTKSQFHPVESISAEFIPDRLRQSDQKLGRLSAGIPPDSPAFSDIIHRSSVMDRIIQKARHVAPRSVPALIEGESGTGKELLARAIHRAGPRKDNAFVAVNCGAIPADLVESEFFGHEKGAFTGAHQTRIGYFEAANRGTLFLDEIGELPLAMPVKFLRVIQENEVVRIGATSPIPLDVRIIAATHRNLAQDMQTGRFRPDLFYRLAVAILKLPPIRERAGDMGILIDHLLNQINQDSETEPGYIHKELSVSAKNIMLQHPWPGNVRELLNTLRRAALWSSTETIGPEDIRDALIQPHSTIENDLMNRPLGESFSLQELIQTLARHYIQRALKETGGNKTRAAGQLGFSSYQTLTNWIKKYGIE